MIYYVCVIYYIIYITNSYSIIIIWWLYDGYIFHNQKLPQRCLEDGGCGYGQATWQRHGQVELSRLDNRFVCHAEASELIETRREN